MVKKQTLPVPPFFRAADVKKVRRVEYQRLVGDARDWRNKHRIPSASSDKKKLGLLIVDAQNTFCLPDFELFVGGRSGAGAIDDNVRLCEFIYRNLGVITQIAPTMDTHTATQIFHEQFFVNDEGKHPAPMTMISTKDILGGIWKVNPAIAHSIAAGNYNGLQQHVIHYVRELEKSGRYQLTIWPYHAMLGGIGHCLVASVEEALFFHNIARDSQTDVQIKGGNPLAENYSILRPEILKGAGGGAIGQKNTKFIKALLSFDYLAIAGQAKSHCVAWTIADLLSEINDQDPALAQKVYLLEDCTSAVVVPGIVDFTPQADQAFADFEKAGMHLVKSTDPIENWPGIDLD